MLLLASQSPQRKALLELAGLRFRIQPADIDESWREGEHPATYVERLAREKAQAVPAAPTVLAADTCVWLEARPEPLGKPRDRSEARSFLRWLFEAESHYVSTGFAVLRGTQLHSECVTTRVWMRPPSDAAFEAYLDTEDWRGRAGAYAIQGPAAAFVRRIEGSYTNVVGLPVAEVLDALLDAVQAPRSTTP